MQLLGTCSLPTDSSLEAPRTVVGIGRLVALATVGVIRTWLGLRAAITLFAAGLALTMTAAVRGLRLAPA